MFLFYWEDCQQSDNYNFSIINSTRSFSILVHDIYNLETSLTLQW